MFFFLPYFITLYHLVLHPIHPIPFPSFLFSSPSASFPYPSTCLFPAYPYLPPSTPPYPRSILLFKTSSLLPIPALSLSLKLLPFFLSPPSLWSYFTLYTAALVSIACETRREQQRGRRGPLPLARFCLHRGGGGCVEGGMRRGLWREREDRKHM